MRFPDFQELQTSRLHLRKIDMADLEDLYAFASSEAVTRYMLFNPHKSLADSVASIEKCLARYAAGRNYRWGIALKESNRLIGMIDLLGFQEAEGSCSFAYMLGEDFWGRGYGTEALHAVFQFGFNQMELRRIEADHMAPNAASGGVMRKCGMEQTGMYPGKYEKNGITYDAVCYSITREQWEQK